MTSNEKIPVRIADSIRDIVPDVQEHPTVGPPLAYLISALLVFIFIGGITPELLQHPQLFTIYLMIVIGLLVGIVMNIIV
jgi:hypothetical protein